MRGAISRHWKIWGAAVGLGLVAIACTPHGDAPASGFEVEDEVEDEIGAAVKIEDEDEGEASTRDPRTYLVWTSEVVEGEARPVTRWYGRDAAGDVEVLGRREGLWTVADGALWEMTSPTARWETLDCSALYGEPDERGALPAASKVTHTSKGVAFTSTDGRSREAIAPLTEAPGEPVEGEAVVLGDFAQYHRPVAGLGSLIFLISNDYSYECGAHGGVSAGFLAFDLATGEAVPLVEQAGKLGVAVGRETQIREALAARDGWIEVDEPAELTAVFPRLTEGGLQADFQYTAGSCYACSDGSWHSYSVSTVLTSDRLPPVMQRHASAPDLVQEILLPPAIPADDTGELGAPEVRPGEGTGWSAVPETGAVYDAVRTAFVERADDR